MGTPADVSKMLVSIFIILLIANMQLVSCSFLDLSSIKKPVKGPRIVNDIGSAEYRPIGTMKPENSKPQIASSPFPKINLPFKRALCLNDSIPQAPKRVRNSSVLITFESSLSADDIIEREINGRSFNGPEKKEMYKKVLQIIAANDFEKFEEIKIDFLKIFNLKYLHNFERLGLKDYLVRFMVLFGADKFAKSCGEAKKYQSDLVTMEIIKYLIESKPLNVVLNTLLGFKQIIFTSEMISEIKTILTGKYPEMNFACKLVLNLIQPGSCQARWNNEILSLKSDLETFKKISLEFGDTSRSFRKFYYSVAIENPELYAQCNQHEKFRFIKSIISMDDIEAFEKIVDFDLEMIKYVYTNRSIWAGCWPDSNLMEICFDEGAFKCFALLLEIIPEMLEKPQKYPCTLGRAVSYAKPDILDLILSNGYTADSLVKSDANKEYTIIQYAFLQQRKLALEYFIAKFGAERVKDDIRAIWPTDQLIKGHINQHICGMMKSQIDFMFEFMNVDRNIFC